MLMLMLTVCRYLTRRGALESDEDRLMLMLMLTVCRYLTRRGRWGAMRTGSC